MRKTCRIVVLADSVGIPLKDGAQNSARSRTVWLDGIVDTVLNPAWLYPWLGASLAALAVFELLRHGGTKAYRSLCHRWVALRALRGEQHAEEMLVDAGFRIVGRQVERGYMVRVDDKDTRVIVRADLLVVDRDGETLVAEAKTGREAPRIENSATRRQLLEYRLAFGTQGVLLVDATSETIHSVCFPQQPVARNPSTLSSWTRAAVIGFLLGIASTIAMATYLGWLDLR